MKKKILIICSFIIGLIIIGGGIVYYLNQGESGEYISYYKDGGIKEKGFKKNGKRNGDWVGYHKNGLILAKGSFKDGEQDGEWEKFFENGNLEYKGFYRNGNPDGEWKWYHKNGNLMTEGFFKDGEGDGERIYYDENGRLKSKMVLKDGKANGELIVYYENGQIDFKGQIENDKRIGEWEKFFENGNLEYKGFYRNGNPDGEWKWYHKNGNLMTEGFFKDGEWDGERIYYYENGQLKSKMVLKDGKANGELIVYYENGQIDFKGQIENDKRIGRWEKYFEDGQIYGISNFNNGKIDGKGINYFKDGKITEMNFKDGKKDGIQTGYYEDGTIRLLYNFKNGEGIKSYFNKDGDLYGTGTETYIDEFDEESGEYKSLLNGLDITYYDNGQLYEISSYKDGKLNGTQTGYDEDGNLESVCYYTNGIKDGTCLKGGEMSILPDSIKIDVKSPLIAGEQTNLGFTVMKDGEIMTNYEGMIFFNLVDEDGYNIPINHDHSLPGKGLYKFLKSDQGYKEFQKGLQINKEGTFYIQVADLDDPDMDRILGKQLIRVFGMNNPPLTYDIHILSPEMNSTQFGDNLTVNAITPDLPDAKAKIYVDGKIVGDIITNHLGEINYTVGGVGIGEHILSIEIPDIDGNILGVSQKIKFTTSIADNK